MSLSWKDAVATTLIGAAAVVTYARLQGSDWLLMGSWREASLLLIILGLGAYIVADSGVIPARNGWTAVATMLGSLAFMLAVMNLIFNNQLMFLALAFDLAALWLTATAHHLFGSGAHHEQIVYYRAPHR